MRCSASCSASGSIRRRAGSSRSETISTAAACSPAVERPARTASPSPSRPPARRRRSHSLLVRRAVVEESVDTTAPVGRRAVAGGLQRRLEVLVAGDTLGRAQRPARAVGGDRLSRDQQFARAPARARAPRTSRPGSAAGRRASPAPRSRSPHSGRPCRCSGSSAARRRRRSGVAPQAAVVVEHLRLVEQRLGEQQRPAGIAGQQHPLGERGVGWRWIGAVTSARLDLPP